ncbi:polycystin-1-related protein-like [Ptychodera flava]|uniref:polycystin-1-related protein-like n=1 Tax=Ptychodera flava TaxID=63121 RepID=UPI003969C6D9
MCSTDSQGSGSIIERTNSTGSQNQVLIFENSTFQCYGTMVGLRFWSIRNEPFKVGVWRKLRSGYFSVVGETQVEVNTTGNNSVYFSEGIPFSVGDVIGVRWLIPSLGYDTTDGDHVVNYADITTEEYAESLEYSTVKNLPDKFNRIYSVEAIIRNELTCPVEALGHDATSRTRIDDPNYAVVLAGLPMPCYGRVYGWRYFSNMTSDFNLGIYRPVAGSTDNYKLIGESLISGDHPTSVETVVYLQKAEQLDFLPGDVIGFRFKVAVISYDSDGEDSVLTKWLTHNATAYQATSVGDTLKFNHGSGYRSYSVSALLTPYDYHGCHREAGDSREFAYAATGYSSFTLTPGLCIELCGEQGFKYSGLQQGELCFCGNSYGSYGNGDPSDCSSFCSGDDAITCGGTMFNDVYKSAEAIIGFHILPFQDYLSTYSNVPVVTNASAGSDVFYSFELSDGNSIWPTDDGEVVHYFFRRPGKFAIQATGVDRWSTVIKDTVTVDVETPVGNITFACPDANEINTVFICDIEIDQGTNMSATVNFSDIRIVDMDIADAEGVWYGSVDIPDFSLNDEPTKSVYLLVNQHVTKRGKLVAWELNAIATGLITLQVYRPSCPGQQFCYRSYNCISLSANCSDEVSVWSKSCNSFGTYSFTRQRCINITNSTVVGDKVFYSQPVDYEFIAEFNVTIKTVGLNYIPIDGAEQLKVTPGDVIAWYHSNEGRIGYVRVDNSEDGLEFIPNSVGYDLRHTLGYIAQAAGSTEHRYKHSLRAHVVRPTIIRLRHNYTDEGVNHITLNITNDVSQGVSTHAISIQYAIDNVTFDSPSIGTSGEVITLTINEHPGSDVVYQCQFGDGGENMTTSKSFQYIWNNEGVYRIVLHASNGISEVYKESWITIQDMIEGLHWIESDHVSKLAAHPISPRPLGMASHLNWSVVQGSNITYEVNLGVDELPVFYLFDGDVIQNTSDVLTAHCDAYSGSVEYSYPSIGYYNVSVNASNLVGWQVIHALAIVQINITNFRLIQPEPIPHGEEAFIVFNVDTGTNMTFRGMFNDSELTNEDFIVNEGTHEGVVRIGPDQFSSRGFVVLWVQVENLVSGPYNSSVIVHVEYAVKNLTIWLSDEDVTPGTSINVTFDMESGSGLTLTLAFDDGVTLTYSETEMFRSNGDFKCEVYNWSSAAEYNVTITAANVIGVWTAYQIEYVQNPVRNLTFSTNSPGVILENSDGTIAYTWVYHGDITTPPSTASVHYTIASDIEYIRSFPIDTTGGTVIIHNLTIANYGTYNTIVTISNRVSSVTFYERIEMEELVENLVIITDPTPPYIEVDQTLYATVQYSWGSRVSFEWDFQDDYSSRIQVGIGGATSFSHSYNESGTYQLQVTAENLLGVKTTYVEVKVQYPVRGFVMHGRKLNKLKKLDIGYVTVPFDLYISNAVPQGEFPSEAYYDIDFGDTQYDDIILTLNNADSNRDTASEYHVMSFTNIQYFAAGHYTVNITIYNLVSNGSYSFDFYIYESITDLEEQVKYNEFMMNLTEGTGNKTLDQIPFMFDGEMYLPLEEAVVFTATHTSGTGLTYTWNFGDEYSQCQETYTTLSEASVSSVTQSGNVTVTAAPSTATTAINASSTLMLITTPSGNLTVPATPQTVKSSAPTTQKHTTQETNQFTTDSSKAQTGDEMTVQTTVVTSNPTTMQLDAGTGGCESILVTAEPRVIWWFTRPGDYVVTVNVSNPVHWSTQMAVIHIEARVEGLSLSDHGPMPVNTSIPFELNTGNVGTDACYHVDFQDTTSYINHIAFWGKQETCQLRYAEHFSGDNTEFLLFYTVDSSSLLSLKEAGQDPNITIHNHFLTISEYTIQLTAFNHVSEETAYLVTSVTKGPCYYPTVSVQSENYCNENYILCDDVTGYRQYLASTEIKVYSSVSLNCSTTNRAWFWWRAYKQLDDGSEEEVTDMGNTVTYAAPLKTLTIPKFTLGYGLYRFELNVSMDGEYGVETIDSGYLYVEPTPLRAVISGGSERRVRWHNIVELDGLTETVDPDIDPSDKTGMSFIWMCRRKTYKKDAITEEDYITNVESFEVWNGDYTVLLVAANESVAFEEIRNDNPSDTGGCFGRYGEDDSGPGSKINYTSGHIYIDTTGMYWEMEYELKLIVMKDDRISVAYQVLDVTEGDPPRMSITCKVNCLDKVSTTSRFSLESHDEDWVRGLVLYYRWEIQDIQTGKYRTVSSSQWLPYSGTGNDGQNFSLEKGFLQDVTYYRIKVVVSRNDDFTNYGMASYEIFTNEVPVVGTCYVTPTNGTALNTTFNVHCSGWDDPDRPLNYRFAIGGSNGTDWTWIYSGEKAYMDESVYLPEGQEDNDYNVSILVRVEDSYGSYVDLDELTVQVFPLGFDQTETIDMIKSFTSNEDSLMKQLIGRGDSGAAANIASTCAKMLNAVSTLSTVTSSSNSSTVVISPTTSPGTTVSTGDVIYTTQSTLSADEELIRAENTLIRTELAEGIAAGTVTTMGEFKHFTSAMDTVTYDPYEIDETAQDTILDSCDQWTSFLQEKTSEGQTMVDYIEDAGSGLLAVVSNSMSASKVTVRQYEATEAALQAQLADVDSTPAPDADSLNAKRRRRRDIDQAIADTSIAKEMAKQRTTKAVDLTMSVASIISDKMVAGQDDVTVSGNGIGITAGMTFTDSMENKQYDQGNGVTLQLPDIHTMFGDDNITYVGQKVVTYDDNFVSWTNTSNSVQGRLLSLDLANDTGEAIELKDLQKPIEVWLTRDQSHTSFDEEWQYSVTTPAGENTALHKITLDEEAALTVEVRPLDVNGTDTDNVTIFLYFGFGMYPSDDPGAHHFNCTLPRQPTYSIAENETLYVDNSWELDEPYLWTCFFSNSFIQSYLNVSNDVYIAVKHRGGWNASAADNYLANSDYDNFWKLYYRLTEYTSQCKYFDFEENVWKQDGMEVGPKSTKTNTQCFATHLTLFGGGFQIPMNTIDFSDSAFTKLHENPVVFAFLVSCCGAYLAVLVWARKADKRDLVKVGATPLKDNDPRDKYFYELTVFTGVRNNSATSAKVSIIVTGERGETEPRILVDEKRKIFERGGVDSFVMAVPRSLGNLVHVRLWHDNGGKFPSWFLSRVSVKDLQNDKMFYFMLDRWLAVEEEDGQIERVIPVAGKSELTSFGHLFYSKTRRNISDGHLWFSIFIRPPRSRFTRVQRATCCVSLLFCTMMANILFYNVDVTGTGSGQEYQLGPIKFTLAELCIGVISSLMVFPVNLIVVQIFRNVKEHPPINCCCCRSGKGKRPPSVYQRNIASASSHMGITAKLELERELRVLSACDGSGFLKSGTPGLSRMQSVTPRPESVISTISYSGVSLGMTSDGYMKTPAAGFKKTRKKKKKFELPWGFIYVAWFLALVSMATAFVMTVEVAGQFGREKSQEWLKSMAFSIIQDVLITQPIKVLFLATFYALVIKNPDNEDDDEKTESPHLSQDEEWVHERMTAEELNDPVKLAELENEKALRLSAVRPPDTDQLQEARETRFKEIKMYGIIKEILFYILFLYLLMIICYGNRDPAGHLINKALVSEFVSASYHGKMRFDMISKRDYFWNYTENVLIPSLFSGNWYNGQADTYGATTKTTADRFSVLIGIARFRQLRVHSENCTIHEYFEDIVKGCSKEYSYSNELAENMLEGWEVIGNGTEEPDYRDKYLSTWKYNKWHEIDSYPYYAEHALYNGGGYVANLGNDYVTAMNMAAYLKSNRWVDQQTRAVFIEFVLLNPSTNLFAVSYLLVEFLRTGGAFPYIKFHTMPLDRYYGNWMYVVMAAEVSFVLCILYFLYREGKMAWKEKKKYLKSFWNWMEIISLSLAVTAIVMYFYRLTVSWSVIDRYRENRNAFTNFQYLAYWDEMFAFTITTVLFLSTLKLLKLLKFNRRMLLLSEVIRACSHEVFLFLIIFGLFFFAFAHFAYLIFGIALRDFCTIVLTVESLFSTLLGKFEFEDMVTASRYLGPIFFFFYVMLVMFILLNMFLSIINEGFSRVKADNDRLVNQLEIVDFMINRFKKWTGFSEKRLQREIQHDQYVEGVDPIELDCKEMKAKLTAMVDRLNNFVRAEKSASKDVLGNVVDESPRAIFTSSF